VWAWWNNAAGHWEIDFERVDSAPTVDEVREQIAAHPHLLVGPPSAGPVSSLKLAP